MRIRFRRLLAACVALTATTALGTSPATATSLTSQGLFDDCAAVHAAIPGAPDGNFVLSTDHYLLGVYCHDMTGTPREYLNLANTGTSSNFSQYTAGGSSPGTDVRTAFTKLRVDPATLTVDINDLTFATSSGRLLHDGQPVTSMPYGVAMACDGYTAVGVGNFDLRGTAFAVADAFQISGYQPFGIAMVSSGNQLVNLRGGGHCGWIAPSPGAYNPFNPQGDRVILELDCTPDGAFRPQVCVDLG